MRITSACAEQTRFLGADATPTWDHLRVCGADVIRKHMFPSPLGSPPRVRSRHLPAQVAATLRGITSACAEQTLTTRIPSCIRRDHLRVCGADYM